MPKWKWARHIVNNSKKFIRMFKIFSAQTKRHNIKYKYGVKVLRNANYAIEFNRDNGNNL